MDTDELAGFKLVTKLAWAAAKRDNRRDIDVDDLFVAVLEHKEGLGGRLLADLNLAPGPALVAAGKAVTERVPSADDGPDFSLVAANTLALAWEEAHAEQKLLGSEHVLLALMMEPQGKIREMLEEFGITEAKVRRALLIHRQAEMEAEGPGTALEKPRPGERAIREFGEDITALARSGALPRMVGREKELERLVRTLNRTEKNAPMLIGESGVGKTQIAYGLAYWLVDDPESLPLDFQNRRLISLDITKMVAGSGVRGEFEQRLQAFVDEVKKAGDVIVFIDEAHKLMDAGSLGGGGGGAADILKQHLQRGGFPVVGTTTLDEYRKHVEKDKAMSSRFQPIVVSPPVGEQLLHIVNRRITELEARRHARMSPEARDLALELTNRYFTDQVQPAKAVAVIEEAMSRVDLRTQTPPEHLKDLRARVTQAKEARSAATGETQREAATAKVTEAAKSYLRAKEDWFDTLDNDPGTVTAVDVAEIVAELKNLDPDTLLMNNRQQLAGFYDRMSQRVFDQPEAIKAISDAVRRSKRGLGDPDQPEGGFLLLGPSGTGKTETAKALAAELHGSEEALLRFDMSEYMEKHTVTRLIGAPPSYIGYNDAAQLTEPVRRNPFRVILIDEIEKAHPEVLDIFLQILDYGYLTDSQGNKVDFRNCYLMFTTNIGNEQNVKKPMQGFSAALMEDAEATGKQTASEDAIKARLRPEFLNRLTGILYYKPLQLSGANRILDRELGKLADRLRSRYDVALVVGEDIRSQILEGALQDHGAAKYYNGRPIKRAATKNITDKLIDYMDDHDLNPGSTIYASLDENGEITISETDYAIRRVAAPHKSDVEVEVKGISAPLAPTPTPKPEAPFELS